MTAANIPVGRARPGLAPAALAAELLLKALARIDARRMAAIAESTHR